jgi:hypothetical protein
MAPIRHVAPGGGVELEVDPASGHAAWRVAGRRATVTRARAVAGDGAVDAMLRRTLRELRAAAAAADGDAAAVDLRALAARLWAERTGGGRAAAAGEEPRLF